MREGLLEMARCSRCRAGDFDLEVIEPNDVEIRRATVRCRSCGCAFSCQAGILDLLTTENEQVRSERTGWATMATYVENTDELMLSLPDGIGEHKQAWKTQADNFHLVWPQVAAELTGTEKVLDLGAGRCWSTRFFARLGCDAVGLDVLLTKYVGLLTADVFIEREGVFFERVCGDMNELPFRDRVFDLVFITATLHHTSDPRRVLAEVSRVLRPGGRLVMINEPVASFRRSTRVEGVEKEHGINENIYRLPTYLSALRAAGFRYHVLPHGRGYNRLITPLNRWLRRAVKPWRRWPVLPPLVYAQHLMSGGDLNVEAMKVA